jgi:hypothetical protein
VTVAPHLLVARRARIWVVAGALLGLGVLRVGPLAGAAAVGGLLGTGLLSMRLARALSTAQLRQARAHQRELDDQRAEVADLSAQVARTDGRRPPARQSLVRVAFTRRLGVISATASAIARELRQVEARDTASARPRSTAPNTPRTSRGWRPAARRARRRPPSASSCRGSASNWANVCVRSTISSGRRRTTSRR